MKLYIKSTRSVTANYDNPYASRNKAQAAAFDNACDCINNGQGKGYWLKKGLNKGLMKSISDDIWETAVDYMG